MRIGDVYWLKLVVVGLRMLAAIVVLAIAPCVLIIFAFNRIAYPWDYIVTGVIIIADVVVAEMFIKVISIELKGGQS